MAFHFEAEQWVPYPVEQVFRFFANPGNLPRIMPPSSGTELVRLKLVSPPGMRTSRSTITDEEPIAGAGSEIVTSFRVIPFLPLRAEWIALITEFTWNDHFCDEQKKGPFKSFRHCHRLSAATRDGKAGTMMRDAIDYDIGFGVLGHVAQTLFVERQLRNTFAYRQRALLRLLSGHAV
jgi:ligand-binding SRPBCC domain-containing protein